MTEARPRRGRAALAFAAVLFAHLFLTLLFENPGATFSGHPYPLIDYATHYEQALRAVEAFASAGRTWAWDPHLFAGMPSGAIFDADNKLHELWVIALHRAGFSVPTAFNLFVVAVHLLVVPATWAAARLMGASVRAAAASCLLATGIWFFDGTSHWAWWAGMISWGAAAAFAPLPIALFHRFCQRPSTATIALVAVLLALLHHLHPYVFFVLALPMLADFARAVPRLGWRARLAAVAAAAFVVLANAWWLRVAARFWHYVLRSDFYLASSVGQLAADWLEVGTLSLGPITPQASFRFLAYGLAVVALIELRRRRDARFLPLATALGATFLTAYLGGHVPPVRHVQPYRFAIASAFLAVVPAGLAIDAAITRARALGPRPAGASLGAAFALVAAQTLFADVAFQLPELASLVPGLHLYAARAADPAQPWRGEIRPLPPWERAHLPPPEEMFALDALVRAHDDGKRWLVEDWTTGERLAGSTNAAILGGFHTINLAHSDADFFRAHPDGEAPPGALDAYLARYAVGWIVLSHDIPSIESRDDLLDVVASAGGQRIYRVRAPSSYVVDGPGDATASLDRVVVRGTRGGSMVLRFHYLETLACSPSCRVSREPVDGDRVGFLRIDGAPPDFEIRNAGWSAR